MLTGKSGKGPDDGPQTGPVRRRAAVVVVGAGLAGLAAAYELRQLGVDVVLVEARHRVGGRVHTVSTSAGEYFDAGGEFVSPGHERFLRYAKVFGVELESSKFYDQLPRITLNRQALSPDQAQASMADVDDAFAMLADQASEVDPDTPWTAARAHEWDHLSLRDWLASQKLEPRSRALLRLYWEGGNGISLASHSYLAILAQAAADTHEVNALRCVGGSSVLAQAFAAAIGADRIFLGRPAVAVAYENKVVATTRDGSIFEADWIILATPPGPWQRVHFTPDIHDAPQMGTVLKFVQVLDTPMNASVHAFCDEYITASWGGTKRVLVGFAGGPAAQRCLNLQPRTRSEFLKAKISEMLGHPVPGIGSTHFQEWTAEPFTLGGYSAPAPGQITRMNARWEKAHHRLFFAGEHTSPAFFGFMEGALQSGEMAARRLMRHAFG